MAFRFQPRANLFVRVLLLAALALLVTVSTGTLLLARSSYFTGVGVEVPQPVPFSHAHHVAGLGIDCRYCHRTVEDAAFAGLPETDTCMNCHWQLWTDAPMLAPVRDSWRTGKPIRWRRVHDLPDFVYFDHSIHVRKGVGCVTCHGRVDRMRLAYKSEPLFMKWCLQCHRQPEDFVVPEDKVFDLQWTRPPGTAGEALGKELVERQGIKSAGLTNCSTCHR